jgi:hypothetical protein
MFPKRVCRGWQNYVKIDTQELKCKRAWTFSEEVEGSEAQVDRECAE